MGKLINKAKIHLSNMLEDTGDLVNPHYSYSRIEWLKTYYKLLSGKLYGKNSEHYYPGASDILSFGLLFKAEKGIQGLIKKKEKNKEKSFVEGSRDTFSFDPDSRGGMTLEQGVVTVNASKAWARFKNWVRTTCTKFAGGPYNSNPFKWALFTVLKLALNLTRVAVSLAVGVLALGPVLLARKVATVRAKRAASNFGDLPLREDNLDEESVIEKQQYKTTWKMIHEVSLRNKVTVALDPVVVAKNRVDQNSGKRPEPKLMSELSEDYKLLPRKIVVEGKTFEDQADFYSYLERLGFYNTARGREVATALDTPHVYEMTMENVKGDKPQRTIFRAKDDILTFEPHQEARDTLYFVNPPAASM